MHRTSVTFSGVWLLDEAALLELDAILASLYKALEKRRKSEINAQVRKRLPEYVEKHSDDPKDQNELKEQLRKHISGSYSYDKSGVEVSVKTNVDDSVKAKSFREIIDNRESAGFLPREFNVDISSGSAEISISLDDRMLTDKLEISVSPVGLLGGKPLQELERWAVRHKSSAVMSHWHSFHILYLFGIAMICLLLILVLGATGDVVARLQRQGEASAILREGVSDANRDAAIELILKSTVGVRPTSTSTRLSLWQLGVMVTSLVLTPFFLWTPKTVLGIGRGKHSIERQRWLMWLIWYVISRIILSMLGVGIIVALLKDAILGWIVGDNS